MKVYVGNLAPDINDAQFKDLVTPFGTPETVNLIKDRVTGVSRGFGFVEFQNDDHAKAAIAGLNGKEVSGKVLKVNESQPKGRQ
jgi:RNA recognition motif-containing protein